MSTSEIDQLKIEISLLRSMFETSYRELRSENQLLRLQIDHEKQMFIDRISGKIQKIESIVSYLDHTFPLIPFNGRVSSVAIKRGLYEVSASESILKDIGWIGLHGIPNGILSAKYPQIWSYIDKLGFNPVCIDVFLKYFSNTIFGNILSLQYPEKSEKIDRTTDKRCILIKTFVGDYTSSPSVKYSILPKFDILEIKGHRHETDLSLFLSETNILVYIEKKINIFLEYFILCVKEVNPLYEI